jgi:Undecaprenyl-phosphate galactose phosphotransferase WbaP
MSAAAATSSGLFPIVDLPALACRRWSTLISFLIADVVALSLSGVAAVLVRYLLNGHFTPADYLPFAPGLVLFVLIFSGLGLYPGIGVNPVAEFRRIVVGTSVSYLLIIAAMFAAKESSFYSRGIFLSAAPLSVALLLISRSLVRCWCSGKLWWGIPTVIFGAGETGQWILNTLRAQPQLGFRPIALLDPYIDQVNLQADMSSKIFVGDFSLAPVFAQMHQSCYAIVTLPGLSSRQLTDLVCGYSSGFSQVLSIPDLFGFSSVWISARAMGGVLGLEVSQMFLHRIPRLIKRALDIAFGVALAVLLLPLLVLIYIAIRTTSPGPMLYGQKRVGLEHGTFTAWKFRSMVSNADAVLEFHLERDPELRAQWDRDHKLKQDPRVTRVGKFLRRTSLDELPQIWNVIQGDMSLVGPRPIVTAEISKYGKSFDLYCKVRPGITGMWQISGRNDTSYEHRVQFDEYYVRYWSIWLDAYILFRTIKTVLLTEGAY